MPRGESVTGLAIPLCPAVAPAKQETMPHTNHNLTALVSRSCPDLLGAHKIPAAVTDRQMYKIQQHYASSTG